MSESIVLTLKPNFEISYKMDSNWGAYSCTTEEKSKVKLNKDDKFTIKGILPRLILDQEYIATVEEVYHERFGYGYDILSIYQEIPTDPEKQKKYLESVLTPNQVNEVCKVYPNHDIISLFRNDEIDISKVKGLGLKNYEKVKDKILENEDLFEAISFLSDYIKSKKMILKMVKHFKSATLLIEKMKENPYCSTEVNGIGFKTADPIALKMGYNPEGNHRIQSAIEFILEENEKEGHTYINVSKLIDEVEALIGVSSDLIAREITEIKTVIIVDEKIAFKKTYQSELNIANKLMDMLKNSKELNFNVEEFISRMEKKYNLTLTDQQKTLFYNFKKYSVVLLIGYAGTGKSQMMALLIELLDELNLTYDLLSPTGKAAKVLSNYTNREARTIHRAIGLGRGKDEQGRFLLEADSNKVDEVSMLDVKVASVMINKINNENARLLLIGDDFQISSVGCGNLLHDLIHSGKIPTTKLDIVFRQKEGGLLDIITKVRKNERFVKNDFIGIKKFTDNVTLASVPQDRMVKGLRYYYNELLKKYSPEDIMVLSPTKKGDLGTHAINNYIQSIVNGDKNKTSIQTIKDNINVQFKEEDYIMNVVNTYGILNEFEQKIDIVNGDTGKILSIDKKNNEILVDFEFDRVPFTTSKLSKLLHSWGITMHKSQGSQSPAVLVVLDKSHKYMSNANLLYTALSRTQEELIILTQAETLNFAMRKVVNLQRKTFLKDLLVNGG